MSDIPGRNEAKPRGTPAVPSPSASIILVSPSNRILLIHRVRTSSAFPSAHVFPGGNLDATDGHVPASGIDRHRDNLAYRTGAIRELFEESGILLARDPASPSTRLVSVSAQARLRGRRAIHAEKMSLATWLHAQSPTARLDTENLIPFTHWITPPNVPKRFSTQMYLYFVPVGEEEEGNASLHATSDDTENTAAEWKRASEWVDLSRRGDIILFPPQFLLLHLAGLHLDRPAHNGVGEADVAARREALRRFVHTDGSPPWRDKYISPLSLLGGGGDGAGMSDGRTVLALDQPGLELKGSGLSGDRERVIFVKFRKEGPREVDVGWRTEVEEDAHRRREIDEKQKKKTDGGAKL